MRKIAISIAAVTLAASLAACSEKTQQSAAEDVKAAASDVTTAAQDVVDSPEVKDLGSDIKAGAKDAAGDVKAAASEAGDKLKAAGTEIKDGAKATAERADARLDGRAPEKK